MFALVESESITKYLNGNRGITIGDVQYPQNIFTLWSAAEREAIGIYEVEYNNTNKKDEEWYINTNQSFPYYPISLEFQEYGEGRFILDTYYDGGRDLVMIIFNDEPEVNLSCTAWNISSGGTYNGTATLTLLLESNF